MPAVALDIGTYSIKAVHAKMGKTIEVKRVVEVANEIGLALPTDDAVTTKLETYLMLFLMITIYLEQMLDLLYPNQLFLLK